VEFTLARLTKVKYHFLAGLGTIHSPLVEDASTVGFCLQLLHSHSTLQVRILFSKIIGQPPLLSIRPTVSGSNNCPESACRSCFCPISALESLYLKLWTPRRAQWLHGRPNPLLHINLHRGSRPPSGVQHVGKYHLPRNGPA